MSAVDITSRPRVPMGFSASVFLRFLGPGDESRMRVPWNASRTAPNMSLSVLMLVSVLTHRICWFRAGGMRTRGPLASAVLLHMSLLSVGIRLLVVVILTSTTARLPASTAVWVHSIGSVCMSTLLWAMVALAAYTTSLLHQSVIFVLFTTRQTPLENVIAI